MSKGLEALKEIKNFIENECVNGYEQDISIIEKELEENERLKNSYLENLLNEESKEYIYKKLKALEIIKRIVKIVDYSDHTITNGNLIILQGGEIKTKEEYELLKEVLLCH